MKYKEYQTKGELVFQKLQNNEELTKEDINVVKEITKNPLQEFVRREVPFRLTEFFGFAEKEVDEDLLERIAEVIEDIIDWYEDLYDCIDREIRELLDGKEK